LLPGRLGGLLRPPAPRPAAVPGGRRAVRRAPAGGGRRRPGRPRPRLRLRLRLRQRAAGRCRGVRALLGPVVAHAAGGGGAHRRWRRRDGAAAHRTAAPTDVTPALRGRTVDGAPFDRIVVNGVVQYMTDSERDGWLAAWRDLLAPGGKVVLSDLIDPDRGGLRDLADLLWFGVRHGAPVQAVTSAFGSVTAYWRTRRAAPLLQLRPAELGARAARAGLRSTALAGNLPHFSQRWPAVLERAA